MACSSPPHVQRTCSAPSTPPLGTSACLGPPAVRVVPAVGVLLRPRRSYRRPAPVHHRQPSTLPPLPLEHLPARTSAPATPPVPALRASPRARQLPPLHWDALQRRARIITCFRHTLLRHVLLMLESSRREAGLKTQNLEIINKLRDWPIKPTPTLDSILSRFGGRALQGKTPDACVYAGASAWSFFFEKSRHRSLAQISTSANMGHFREILAPNFLVS
ncbi:hypothetical protein C8J57DRAFT_479492 [Mycena rebaudengoi]|nr:hypothetical protein C8J57DRAFT_479492 [Mycena rebaudengoi]